MSAFCRLLICVCLAAGLASRAACAELEPLLETLLAVGPKGAGNREAAEAWRQLARADASKLPTVLAALDEAEPLSANWVRCAVDAIAERALRGGGKLPVERLEQFVRDRGHAPRARRLAYEWLVRADPSATDRLIRGMLDDPSVELRRDAVARLIDEAARVADVRGLAEALPLYREALTAARDLDQIKLLAARLRKGGEAVDLARHFGFVVRWKLIGPFDNTGEKGYDAVYPPEREIDFDASYPGKHGEVGWIEHESDHDLGRVDLNKALGEEKDVVGYAAAEFFADREQEVELRLASDNAVKLWRGGALIDEHNVYHAGSQFDQYVSRAMLQPGRNVILVKVCQNDQPQDWARAWSFQLRVCDATGGAVLSTDRQPRPSARK
jgi:hypothetical protein